MTQSVVMLLLLISATAILAREARAGSGPRWLDRLADDGAPAMLGVSAVFTLWVVWGSLDPLPIFHDEAAYLLQAQLFARGLAAAPSPPLPEFFEQAHVLVTPVLAPKYPPGFALAMVPGIWLGWPALIPLLLTGLSASLLFVLARRTAGPLVALLATVLWMMAPDNLRYRAAYFSELLSGAFWLLGWWALLRWRDSGRDRFLVAVAICAGCCAITRPLTALVYAAPIGVVVLAAVARQRRWRLLALPIVAGTLIVALLPLHNRLVTGSWRLSPYSLYTRLYLPFDVMGFGLRAGQPERELPPDLRQISEKFQAVHAGHTLGHLPATLVERAKAIEQGLSPAVPVMIGIFLLLGLAMARGPLVLGAVTALLLIVVHLLYAHTPDWTIYYLESLPVLAALASLGWSTCCHRLTEWRWSAGTAQGRNLHRIGMAAAVALLLWRFPAAMDQAASLHRANSFVTDPFHRALERVPAHSIVFVHYAGEHQAQFSLVANSPDPVQAPIWIVYDRGNDNERLLRLAPDRSPFRYLEAQRRIVPLSADPPNRNRP
ncbi:MAG: hypothetical protein ABJC74_05220 [Gemmatimonadota bacterium]